MRRKIRKGLRFFTDVTRRIPTKDDTIFVKVAKVLSIADLLYSTAPNDLIGEFMKERDLGMTSNRVLVDLIFSSMLLDQFVKREIILEDYGYAKLHILELRHKKLGSLYFVETRYSSGESYKKAIVLHPKGFDFKKLMEGFWKCYEGRLHIGFMLDGGFSCSEFPTEDLQLYGKNAEVARDLTIQHIKYMNASLSRSYLFLGEPGTGKSSCAMYFSSKLGQRIIKIEASALVLAGKSLRFLFDQLAPDFVLIDDIDKDENVAKNMASVLSSVEWIKMSNPEVTIVFTANDISKLDKAFWRPGRVDSITIFDQPDKDSRIQLVKGFIEQFKVALPEGYTIEQIVEDTSGMSPVWLREIVLRFKYDSPENILTTCRQMHRIVNGESITGKKDKSEHSNGKMTDEELQEAAAKVEAASKDDADETAPS